MQTVPGTACLSDVSPFQLPPRLKKLDLSLDFEERESERRDNHRLSSMSSRECSVVSSSTNSVLMNVASGQPCGFMYSQYSQYFILFYSFFHIENLAKFNPKNSIISRIYTMEKNFPISFSSKKENSAGKKNTAMDGWTFDANYCLDICK